MKNTLILSFFILTLGINGQTLTFTIFNKTVFDLDSISICEGQFFKIKAGQQLKVESCKSVKMQDGLPLGIVRGNIVGLPRNREVIGICGVGITEVYSGNYQVDIVFDQKRPKFRFLWDKHKDATATN